MSDNNEQRHVDSTVMLSKIIIVVVFVYPLVHYSIFTRREDVHSNSTDQENPRKINESVEEAPQVLQIPKKIVAAPPSCPISHLQVVLQELCRDLVVQKRLCTPEDFHNLEKHKIPKSSSGAQTASTGEPRGTIVGCVAAGLLLTSLGAAFIELYKAKSQTPIKAKPPMSRKCSLADLTVLKHNRKELVRRESIMELPENGGPIKPLGFRPPPLYRRCSFPVGPSEINCPGYDTPTRASRRTSIECRKLSIIDSRRSSVDRRQSSFDNESPERRHWSRLVHRH